MSRAFLLSLRQLADPAVLRVLGKSLAVTLAILALPGIGYWYVLDRMLTATRGNPDTHGYMIIATVIFGFMTAWLLFRIVAIAVIGFFADDVVEAVERRHYPADLAKARPVRMARAVRMGTVSGLRALLVNLLILPLSLFTLLPGIGAPLLFLLANGWLLGRDLGDMVAVRHLASAALPGWRRETRIPRFVLGLGTTALFLVPVAGLLAPLLGAAMATHLFHRRSA